MLTHWGRVMPICVGTNTIIGSDNGLSLGRCQAIIWTNAGILLIEPLATNFSESLIEILTFSFKKMCLNVSSVKWRPSCLGLNFLSLSKTTRSWLNRLPAAKWTLQAIYQNLLEGHLPTDHEITWRTEYPIEYAYCSVVFCVLVLKSSALPDF